MMVVVFPSEKAPPIKPPAKDPIPMYKKYLNLSSGYL